MPARIIKLMSVAIVAVAASMLWISAASAGCYSCGCGFVAWSYPGCANGAAGYVGYAAAPAAVYPVPPSYVVEFGPTYRVVLVSPFDVDRRFEYPVAQYYPYAGPLRRHRHAAYDRHW